DITLYAKYAEGEVFIPEDYEFLITQNDEVEILAYYGIGGVLSIPSEIAGYPVTKISNYAFSNNDNVTSIDVPDSVKHIGFSAFLGMKELVSINIGSGLETIESGALAFCEKLETVYFEDSPLQSISSETFVSDTALTSVRLPNNLVDIYSCAFLSTFSLKSIVFPDSLKYVGIQAFQYSGLETVTFNEGIQGVDSSSFSYNMSLQSIYIPESMFRIDNLAFLGCEKLSSIEVSINNDHFKFENGVLYNYDKTEIYIYLPSNQAISYTLPETITSLRPAAFSNASFEEFNFNSTLTYIPDYAFYHCSNLTEIVIPEQIKSAGISVFDSATALEKVTFPDDFKEIPETMFRLTFALKEVNFSKNLQKIGVFAFIQSGIEELDIPETLDHIADWAFVACFLLDELKLPDTLRYIDFLALPVIQKVNIPKHLEFLGNRALGFGDMDELVFPDSLTSVGEFLGESEYKETRYIDFGNVEDVVFNFYNGSRLEAIVLGENTKTVSLNGHSVKMIHLYVPNSITEINIVNDYEYDNYVIHGLGGSSAEAYAIDKGIPFMRLDQTESFEVTVNIDGFAKVNEAIPSTMTKGDFLKFSVDVLEGYMIYSVKVNGYPDINANRHFYYCVTEDLVIDMVIKPIDYILDYEYLTISDQLIAYFNGMNSEYVNFPSEDSLGNPIIGFKDDIIPLSIINNPYSSILSSDTTHNQDIIHLGFTSNMTHVPVVDKKYNSLESINIPEGVLTMGGIEETPKLSSVVYPSTLTEFPYWVDDDFINRGVFRYCYNLEFVVVLSENITEVPAYSFTDTLSLKRIVLPNTITSIGDFSFINNANLKELYLNNPNTVLGAESFKIVQYGYVFSVAPFALPEIYRKTPNLVLITPSVGAVSQFGEDYYMNYIIGERVYVSYLDSEGEVIEIQMLLKGEDSL
ncbi:MAG: leucine-rich repeat domain-containing protein, partial [Bacilli bacterium]|nr:leucine-rich repeat domain-containing protein [Bacilli bacterium]